MIYEIPEGWSKEQFIRGKREVARFCRAEGFALLLETYRGRELAAKGSRGGPISAATLDNANFDNGIMSILEDLMKPGLGVISEEEAEVLGRVE